MLMTLDIPNDTLIRLYPFERELSQLSEKQRQ